MELDRQLLKVIVTAQKVVDSGSPTLSAFRRITGGVSEELRGRKAGFHGLTQCL